MVLISVFSVRIDAAWLVFSIRIYISKQYNLTYMCIHTCSDLFTVWDKADAVEIS